MASQFQIDKDVPLPANAGCRGRAPKYPWREMDIGDSFAVPLSGNKHRTGSDMVRVRLQTAAAGQTKSRGSRFSIRQLNDQGIVRVWRVQ